MGVFIGSQYRKMFGLNTEEALPGIKEVKSRIKPPTFNKVREKLNHQ